MLIPCSSNRDDESSNTITRQGNSTRCAATSLRSNGLERKQLLYQIKQRIGGQMYKLVLDECYLIEETTDGQIIDRFYQKGTHRPLATAEILRRQDYTGKRRLVCEFFYVTDLGRSTLRRLTASQLRVDELAFRAQATGGF